MSPLVTLAAELYRAHFADTLCDIPFERIDDIWRKRWVATAVRAVELLTEKPA